MKLAVLSFNDYQRYFRRGWCEAAEESGTQTLYVHWGKQIDFLRRGEIQTSLPGDAPIGDVAGKIREFAQGDRMCIVDSMAFHCVHKAFPLRRNLRDSIWIYDVFDYFFYDSTGKILLMKKIKDGLNRMMADKVMVLSQNLIEVYPSAFHLDNASHLQPAGKKGGPRKSDAVLASFDARFDYGLMADLAELLPDFAFHFHGWIKDDSAKIKSALDELTARRSNVVYHGPYSNAELDELLNDYDIGLLPYVQNHVLTRYVNPDKLYHYLCKGMEVVATPIPQAQTMRDKIHLAGGAREFAQKLRAIAENGLALNDGRFHLSNNWRTRWREFLSFVER
ncbi:MAG: hypothetical protein HY579_01510 [Nitrospinae bacterium]|nr:hypothetical protein [Nitrospinota bacterium]